MATLNLTKAVEEIAQTVRRGSYYTDGNRLYYIVKVHSDNTVEIENCSTEFVNLNTLDYIKNWKRVVY